MSNPVYSQHAHITTATVQLRIVTVGAKQMSMAVFRQLPLSPILERDKCLFKIIGNPWGRVNYYFDEPCQRSGHLHVLFDKNGELHRSCIDVLRSMFTAPGRLADRRWVDVDGEPTFSDWWYELISRQEQLPNPSLTGDYVVEKRRRLGLELATLMNEANTLEVAYQRAYDELLKLPQLFIAV